MMLKVYLYGDSWSVGEWDDDGLVEKTYDKFFKIKNNLIFHNFGKGASSNNHEIFKIENCVYNNFNPDFIFWIQTDPLRDLRPYTENFYNMLSSYDNFLEKYYEILDNTYKKLNSYKRKIYCLGGCSKLESSLVKNYENLIPLIYSIPEFLYPDYNHPKVWFSEWHKLLFEKKIDKKLLDFLTEQLKLQNQLREKKYEKLFFPDGGHPNRWGILRVCDLICNTIEKNL